MDWPYFLIMAIYVLVFVLWMQRKHDHDRHLLVMERKLDALGMMLSAHIHGLGPEEMQANFDELNQRVETDVKFLAIAEAESHWWSRAWRKVRRGGRGKVGERG